MDAVSVYAFNLRKHPHRGVVAFGVDVKKVYRFPFVKQLVWWNEFYKVNVSGASIERCALGLKRPIGHSRCSPI